MATSFGLLRFMANNRVSHFLSGHLYMNSLEYFANLEGDKLRSDLSEGAHSARQVKDVAIQDKNGTYVPIGGIINPIFFRPSQPSGINIFCLYRISFPDGFPINQKNFEFGESCVVLTEPQEFLNRVERAPLPEGRKLYHGCVEYVERTTYDGSLGPFKKLNDHKYQQEFRIAVTGGNETAFELKIGDIRDICDFGPTIEINKRLRVNSAEEFELAKWHNAT